MYSNLDSLLIQLSLKDAAGKRDPGIYALQKTINPDVKKTRSLRYQIRNRNKLTDNPIRKYKR